MCSSAALDAAPSRCAAVCRRRAWRPTSACYDRRVAMTEHKPPGKSWDSWIEELIRQARAEGAFDDLEGKGKPIPGLDAPYDPDWWVKKLLEREKISVLTPALEVPA